MAYALIDNASLTAVERALGKIIVKNPDTINGDLAAVENFLQAILFYDDLVSIDNYKAEFAESRARDFSFVNFLAPDQYGLAEIDGLAKAEARAIRPEIKGGEFADPDFKELLELLKLSMVCTWDMRSSVYYLTMKMLGQPYTSEYDKYSELSTAIFNELSDVGETKGRWSKDVKLVSSEGHIFNSDEFGKKSSQYGGMTKALEMFVAALNWLAYKSVYYSLAAKHLQADSFIHPIRHAYQLHWMKKTGAFGHDFTARLINNLSHKITNSISDVIGHGRAHTVALEMPIFSAWLTQASGSLEQALKAALELKKANQFVVARETMKEIKIAYDESGLTAGNKLTTKLEHDLNKISGDLRRAYGVPSAQGIQGSFLIKTINFAGGLAGIPSLPDKEFALSTPEFLKSRRTKAFSTIFKDVANELTAIERLGGLRDKMSSGFKVDDELYVRPKTEDPKFRRFSSHWKMPM
jgi:hypothetical protein